MPARRVDPSTGREWTATDWDRTPSENAGTGGFFAPAAERWGMSTLREAISNLPDAAHADLLESDDAYLLVIDLPGATAETTDVRVDDGFLRIEARRDKDVPEGFTFRREDRALFLDAKLPLPPDASDEEAGASIDRGVLELELPKRGHRGRTIPIEDA